ncbi:hypothetical protein [Rhodopseudomonas sp.]|uniref:hypothetical protein n=1 Tax=Rhodopseudomonas sp. TaxID=1078 RepID=UPI0039E3AA1F
MPTYFDELPIDPAQLSQHQLARIIAARLENLGHRPFASDKTRYAVLLEDRRGEIIELGRPLRGMRFFPTKALKRNIQILEEMKRFVRQHPGEDWLYWTFCTPNRKAGLKTLVQDVQEFNRLINIEFSQLRKHYLFEIALITIHIKYDDLSEKFDLHAHVLCQCDLHHREEARRRLMQRFSRADLPDTPVRNMAAAVTYMLWGVYRLREMIDWPAEALAAAWCLSQRRSQLVRTGGRFRARLGRKRKAAELDDARKDKIERRRKNRCDTRDPRRRLNLTGDAVLTRTQIRIGGKKVSALLVERGGTPPRYPTATCATAQDRPPAPIIPPAVIAPNFSGHSRGKPKVHKENVHKDRSTTFRRITPRPHKKKTKLSTEMRQKRAHTFRWRAQHIRAIDRRGGPIVTV